MVGISGLAGGVPFEMANPWRKKRKGVPDSTRIERFVASYEALAAAATPATVDDVRAQVDAAPSAETEFGGADADIVVDGVLRDFNVTIKPQLRTKHLRQAVGYWLFDTGDELGIRSVAIDLMRRLCRKFVLEHYRDQLERASHREPVEVDLPGSDGQRDAQILDRSRGDIEQRFGMGSGNLDMLLFRAIGVLHDQGKMARLLINLRKDAAVGVLRE